MKSLLPLSALALLLAGCSDDNATNPWSTAEERAASRAEQAVAKHQVESAKKGADTAANPAKPAKPDLSIFKQKEEAPKVEEAPKTAQANHALIVAIRADAGLIQFKRTEATNPGDKLILTKDGASLLVVVSIVEGESVIADIAPKQVKIPAILVGDEVACAQQTEEKK